MTSKGRTSYVFHIFDIFVRQFEWKFTDRRVQIAENDGQDTQRNENKEQNNYYLTIFNVDSGFRLFLSD